MMPITELAMMTPPNSASWGEPDASTITTSRPMRALNLVSTLARRISVTVRDGAGGTSLTRPRRTRSSTSAAVRPSRVTRAGTGTIDDADGVGDEPQR
jgi:hypothetical protein